MAVTGVGDRPLLYSRPEDRTWLRRIGQEVATARDLGVPTDQFESWGPGGSNCLALGFANGKILAIGAYVRSYPLKPQGHILPRATTARIIPGEYVLSLGQGQELVASKSLHNISNRCSQLFPTEKDFTITTDGDRLIIAGAGIVGDSVTIRLSPVLEGCSGGEVDTFVLATLPVVGDSYHWSGRLHTPPGWKIYHPVREWMVSMTINPYTPVPIEALTLGKPIKLPIHAVASPVRTVSDLLGQLHETSYASNVPSDPFPVWPSGLGSIELSWEDFTGHTFVGDETVTMTPSIRSQVDRKTGLLDGPLNPRKIYTVTLSIKYHQQGTKKVYDYAFAWKLKPGVSTTFVGQHGTVPNPTRTILWQKPLGGQSNQPR